MDFILKYVKTFSTAKNYYKEIRLSIERPNDLANDLIVRRSFKLYNFEFCFRNIKTKHVPSDFSQQLRIEIINGFISLQSFIFFPSLVASPRECR